jgi:hypothetical protein
MIWYIKYIKGFRDSVEFLTQKNLNPKIPTCSQLEIEKCKRLTIKQTSDSRLVTKCRFIVEKKIGEIKRNHALNKNKRRNSELGHLAIDYRIACAMINYLHKPCITDLKKKKDGSMDEKRAQKIGSRLLHKCKNSTENHLENILKLRLGTSAIPKVKFEDVSDFPKMSRATMVSKLFFGNYYIHQSIRYLDDLLKTGWVSRINQSVLEKAQYASFSQSIDLNRTRILGIKMISRHKRSVPSIRATKKDTENKLIKKKKKTDHIQKFKKYYTVFVQYMPNINRSKSILCKIFV